MSHEIVDRPIFFVGTGRSGTTIIYEIFAKHPELAWLSTYSEKFPRTPWINRFVWFFDNSFIKLSGQKQQYNNVGLFNRYLPKPGECYRFWNLNTGVDFARDYLLGQVATRKTILHLQDTINKIIKYRHKNRFSTKITGPGRITYLDSIFPNAIFIHIIRDGRSVTESLMNVDFWKDRQSEPWWNGGLSKKDLKVWKDSAYSPYILTAIQWNRIVKTTQEEGKKLENFQERYLEIKYEDFLTTPEKVLEKIWKFCDLQYSSKILEECFKHNKVIKNLNKKFLLKWDQKTIEEVESVTKSRLKDLGYIK